MALKKAGKTATIDVNLVTFKPQGATDEFAVDTASKIDVTPQVETTKANKLIINGNLIAQKPEVNTLTGNEIKLTDNVFTPELVQALQGGTLTMDTTDTSKVVAYTPPAVGTTTVKPFELSVYSAEYDTSGLIKRYEKITYPNCQGAPIAFSSEEGKFRTNDYTIQSMPQTGTPPYTLTYVDALPTVS